MSAGKKRILGLGNVGANELFTLIIQNEDNTYLFSGFKLSEIGNIHITYHKGVCKAAADNGHQDTDTKE